VSVVQELQAKKAELEDRLKAIRAEAADLTAKMAALDAVIQIYKPDTAVAKPSRNPKPSLLAKINKRQALLEILRQAAEPQSTADCAAALTRSSAEVLSGKDMTRLTSSVSAALDTLVKQGRVRRVETIDGHRWLWEIAL
jgi:predicted RNA-binding Zn ribbon-like protein